MTAFINRIATAVPAHDVHAAFLDFAQSMLTEDKARFTFRRMSERSGIAHRYSVFQPAPAGDAKVDMSGFYTRGAFPGTSARMAAYAQHAPDLAERAVAGLGDVRDVTHLVVASCTGFMAPGLDQVIAARIGLAPHVNRTTIGFMGCYAAVPALRLARDTVLADPAARVLVLNVELCSLHLRETADIPTLLTAMLFADAASAALVTVEPAGIRLGRFHSETLPDSADMMTWSIGDQGFEMFLSGKVPAAIATALRHEADRNDSGGVLAGTRPEALAHWAVHAGGRTVLDAVEAGLRLPEGRLDTARAVLRDIGNVSSVTLMAVLSRMLGGAPGPGLAMAFGPGLAAETFRFDVLA